MFNSRRRLALSLVLLSNAGLSASLLYTGADSSPTSDCVSSSKGGTSGSRSCNRLYIGGFGGGIYSDSSHMSQLGVALFTEGAGGPLDVVAKGHTKKNGIGFGGVQLGYESSKCVDECSRWTLAPGTELEAYWFSRHVKGSLFNNADPARLPEHDFVDTFHMNEGVYLANLILSLNNTWRLSPYIGGGVGATRISLHDANSKQVAPLESGINHFNSRTHDSSWAFAAQVKAGLRYNFGRYHLFGEYRYLFVDFSNYIFGPTVYPGIHAPTTPWNVKIDNIQYNAFVFGIQFDLY